MVKGWGSVDPEVVELLAGRDLDKLWRAARRRLEANGLTLYGTPLVLKGLTRDEADAVAGALPLGSNTNVCQSHASRSLAADVQ